MQPTVQLLSSNQPWQWSHTQTHSPPPTVRYVPPTPTIHMHIGFCPHTACHRTCCHKNSLWHILHFWGTVCTTLISQEITDMLSGWSRSHHNMLNSRFNPFIWTCDPGLWCIIFLSHQFIEAGCHLAWECLNLFIFNITWIKMRPTCAGTIQRWTAMMWGREMMCL